MPTGQSGSPADFFSANHNTQVWQSFEIWCVSAIKAGCSLRGLIVCDIPSVQRQEEFYLKLEKARQAGEQS